MNEAVAKMLERYRRETVNDHLQALREILQEVALLGIWRRYTSQTIELRKGESSGRM